MFTWKSQVSFKQNFLDKRKRLLYLPNNYHFRYSFFFGGGYTARFLLLFVFCSKHFIISCSKGLLVKNFFSFCMSEKVLFFFYPYFWKVFPFLGNNSRLAVFKLSDVAALSPGMHCFWWEIGPRTYICSSVHNVSFFPTPAAFKVFSLSLILWCTLL